MKDVLSVSHIMFKKENIIKSFTYNDVEFILYHNEEDGNIVVIEINTYKDDKMEEHAELYRIMNIILYKNDDGEINIRYTAYKSHIASIKNIEEADKLLDAIIDEYNGEFEEWYEMYFKGKEN